ncbi:MAG: DDE-type integrase/transposase/recombinase [Polyangiaceae bacterium]
MSEHAPAPHIDSDADVLPDPPERWPTFVRTAFLHVVALARLAALQVSAGFFNGPFYARRAAQLMELQRENALLREELRVKDERMSRTNPETRPHFKPADRLAILELRAAWGWSISATALRFQLTPQTIATWLQRIDADGPNALVRTRVPVNRYPQYVDQAVQSIRTLFPTLGAQRIGDLLANAGIHLAEATVRRMLKRTATQPPSPPRPDATQDNRRPVRARYPHHVWHVDLTFVPYLGLTIPWFPLVLPRSWPFGYWVTAFLDHSSRAVIAARASKGVPNADDVAALLDSAVTRAGRAPKYVISDRGTQFQSVYFAACARLGITPRFGAIGMHGAIAVIERFWRSMKTECFRRFMISLDLHEMQRDLDDYCAWYNHVRPHMTLAGKRPIDVLSEAGMTDPSAALRFRIPHNVTTDRPQRSQRYGPIQLVTSVVGRAALPVIELRDAA